MILALKKYLFFAFVLLGIYGCVQKDMRSVLKEYIDGISKDPEAINMRANLKDSVQGWIDKGLYFVLFLNKTSWKVDEAVFFNKRKDKALLLILFQPIDLNWPRDYAKIIGAEKIQNSWKFYYASYALDEFQRTNRDPLPFNEIAARTRENLAEDGFIKCGVSCSLNYAYIESDLWFEDWRREMHVKFLNNELPLTSVEGVGEFPK